MFAARMALDLDAVFGAIDIYLFDQILRRRIGSDDRIFDAGCGAGRNLVFLLRSGAEVSGIDGDVDAIREVRALAARLAPALPAENFRAESLEETTFPEAAATVVICSAVLHFARDDGHFQAMLWGAWRRLAPGGVFFCRLASSIGWEGDPRLQPIGGRRYRLADGSDRYLVDEPLLMELTTRLGGRLLDPLKTTIVQGQRSMTTWVVRKN
jgi:tellurite methyltransferase